MKHEELETYCGILDLSEKDISELPSGIGRLTNLQTAWIESNRLKTLPPEIGNLTNLQRLYLSGNELKTLPSEIGRLTKLNVLDLSNNQLSKLPPEIAHLTFLCILNLQHNQLMTLPPEIAKLKNLTQLKLKGNPLPIPPEILEKANEPEAIISFYLANVLDTAAKQPLIEAKVLLVGQGLVGKTSLAMRLMTNTYDPSKVARTEGIDIHRLQIKIDGEKFHLNLWDFGGQEIMHATHQFFFTKRSLYLVVLNSRQTEQENRVEYWLRLIKSFGGESPVIVVCNRCDEMEMEMNWRGLREKYSNIKAIVRRVSCETGEGIEELRSKIEEEVSILPHIHTELLSSWFAVKDELASMSEGRVDFLPYTRYQEICAAHDVTKAEDQKTLIGFLHDLGIVLHFRDHPILEDTNVLNPEWVTQGVYAIINSSLLTEQRGVLKLEDLGSILNPEIYPRDKHLFIIDMMRKFEMCFDFEGFANKKFLISVKLPLEPPELETWPDALRFQYRYEVLPESIITRFMVRMHAYINGSAFWRHGVQLKSEDGENKALVMADIEDRKITIEITGKKASQRDLLKLIRADFYKIHKTFGNLSVQEKIPLSEKPEILVDYYHLLFLEKSKVDSFIPEGCYFSVSVKMLLDGIEAADERRIRDFSEYQRSMGVIMGDQFIIGQAGAVGTGAQAQDMHFMQTWNQVKTQIDLESLGKELERLKKHLKDEAETEEELEAVKNVAAAEREAKAGNGPKMLQSLKKAGVWALKKLDDVGTKVAVEVIKKALEH